MGFDFNSVLNTDIDNTYIDNVQWDLCVDNLFYMLYSNKKFQLYNAEITRDETNSIKIKYTDTERNFDFILQFENEAINQLVPYIEVINFYTGKRLNQNIAEDICNFLTLIFNIIKEYELIHINRIFIKPEIEDSQLVCFTIFNVVFNHLYKNLNLDVFIDIDKNFSDYVKSAILSIDSMLYIPYQTYSLIVEKIKKNQQLNLPIDKIYIKNFRLYEKSVTNIKNLEEYLIFLQNSNIYESINTNKVSNILFKVWDKNTLQYYIKEACHDVLYRKFNPWFYYNDYLQDYYKNHNNNDITIAFMGVIYAIIQGCNISYIIEDLENEHKIQLLKEINNIILNDIKNKGFIYQNILIYYKKEILKY